MIGGWIICSEEWPGFRCCSGDTENVVSKMQSSKQHNHIRQSYQVNIIPRFLPSAVMSHESCGWSVYINSEIFKTTSGHSKSLEVIGVNTVLTLFFWCRNIGEECDHGTHNLDHGIDKPSADLDIAAGSTWAHFTFANGREVRSLGSLGLHVSANKSWNIVKCQVLCEQTLISYLYGWLSKCWFLNSAILPQLLAARLIIIMWAYHTFSLANFKIECVLRSRRSSAGSLFSPRCSHWCYCCHYCYLHCCPCSPHLVHIVPIFILHCSACGGSVLDCCGLSPNVDRWLS